MAEIGEYRFTTPSGRSRLFYVRSDGTIYDKDWQIKSQHIGNHEYPVVHCGDQTFLVHRLIGLTLIANPDNLPKVDHINRVRVDNRMENLRWVNDEENAHNKGISVRNTSGITGISYDSRRNRWCVEIMRFGKRYRERFSTIEEAKEALDKKIQEIVHN